jgi:hypothetical protein
MRSNTTALQLVLFGIVTIFLLLCTRSRAAASIPDANGVYHGCFTVGQKGQQTVYAIDTAITTSCAKNFVAATWNKVGP